MSPNKLRPAVFGGLLIGVLSALPVVNVGNLCCCLWVICGGVLAAYLMQQDYPYAITTGDGAVVGLLAGLIGGILSVVIAVPIEMAAAPFQERLVERILDAGDLPFDVRDVIERFRGPLNPIIIGFRLIFTSIVFTVFGLLGGLLGAAIFKKGTLPPGTAEVLPPQP